MPNSEQTPLVGYPTGIGRRFGAAVYDVLLVVAIWMGTLLVGVLINSGEAITGWWVQLLLLFEWAFFYLYFWSRDGQTLGMTAWRVKLVNSEGKAPSLQQLLIRLAVAPLSIACAGIGYLWFYVGSRKQTWHDQASDTFVVHIPKAKK